MTNEMIYRTEINNLDASIDVLTEAEKEEIRISYKEELKKNYEDEIQILYFLAIDWNVTITVIKAIINK